MSTKLEELGEEYRKQNIVKNPYQEENQYGDTHPNALSDGDVKGRGTNGTSDALNSIAGGTDIDINGNPSVPGSGRNALIAKNEGKYPQNGNNNPVGPNGYGPDKPYYPGYITSQGQ